MLILSAQTFAYEPVIVIIYGLSYGLNRVRASDRFACMRVVNLSIIIKLFSFENGVYSIRVGKLGENSLRDFIFTGRSDQSDEMTSAATEKIFAFADGVGPASK